MQASFNPLPTQTQPKFNQQQPVVHTQAPVKPISQPSNLFVPTNQTMPSVAQSTQPKTLSYQDNKPATAWNDPPIVQPKIKVIIFFSKKRKFFYF